MKRKKYIFTIVPLLIVLMIPLICVYWKERQQIVDRTLIQAIKAGDEKRALATLAEGANGEARDTGEPPSFRKTLRYLIRRLQHPESSPLGQADVANHPSALLVLYHTFYRVNQRYTPGPDPALVRALLEHGAQVNDLDEYDISPLSYASLFSNGDTVSLLLARGADMDLKDDRGLTPLMKATIDSHVDVVRVLLEHGANVSTKGKHRQTALDYAITNVKYESTPDAIKIEALLRKYGAK